MRRMMAAFPLIAACVASPPTDVTQSDSDLDVGQSESELDVAQSESELSDVDGSKKKTAPAPVIAVSLQSTGALQFTDAMFHTVPGMSTALTLPRDALVQLVASGSVATYSLGCHLKLQFLVDGTLPESERYIDYPEDVSPSGDRYFPAQAWTITGAEILSAGEHTIELQAGEENFSAFVECIGVCISLNGGPCGLNLIAIPQ